MFQFANLIDTFDWILNNLEFFGVCVCVNLYISFYALDRKEL